MHIKYLKNIYKPWVKVDKIHSISKLLQLRKGYLMISGKAECNLFPSQQQYWMVEQIHRGNLKVDCAIIQRHQEHRTRR